MSYIQLDFEKVQGAVMRDPDGYEEGLHDRMRWIFDLEEILCVRIASDGLAEIYLQTEARLDEDSDREIHTAAPQKPFLYDIGDIFDETRQDPLVNALLEHGFLEFTQYENGSPVFIHPADIMNYEESPDGSITLMGQEGGNQTLRICVDGDDEALHDFLDQLDEEDEAPQISFIVEDKPLF